VNHFILKMIKDSRHALKDEIHRSGKMLERDIRTYSKELDFYYIYQNRRYSMILIDDMRRHYDEKIWNCISKHQKLTKRFILDNSDVLNKELLRENPYLTRIMRKDPELKLLLVLN